MRGLKIKNHLKSHQSWFKMKKLIYLIPILLVLASCEKELELTPAQSISEDLALSTDGYVKSTLVGAYDQLGSTRLFGGEILRNAELYAGAGEVNWVGTYNAPREIFNKTILVTNGDVSQFWVVGYSVINTVNNVLSALDVVNPDDAAQVEGEALFIRGLVYFELVRMFAEQYSAGATNSQPGVPVIVRPTRGIDESAFVSRASVEEVYAQILEDLNTAEAKLGEPSGFFANKYSAAALLARVHLQMQNYTAARDAANRVIESGEYSLAADYEDLFNVDDDPAEYIFSIQVSSTDGSNNMNEFFSTPAFGGRDGDIEIEQTHLDLYPAGDLRRDLFFEDNGGIYYSGKWNNQYGNIVVTRLAEMYLIRAEANARLGSAIGDTPLNDYNAVHMRAGLSPANSVSIDDILLERRLELAHEGFRIHDLKRLKLDIQGRAWNDPKMIYPIPQREIEANKNLVQNLGY